MKKRHFLLVAALMLSVIASTAQASPKREFRSAWVAGMNIDWPKTKATSSSGIATQKNELITYLDNFKAQNFTGICLHVRPRADAYYKSTLEPWSADLTGTRGKDPGWDPLAFAIEECHKRGLEIYAWVNPFRVNANNVTYTTDFDKQWDANGWLIRYSSWTSFNPGHEGARKHCLDVLKEIYNNYAIDGMLFDDYFYPGNGMPSQSNGNVATTDDDDYEQYIASGTKLSIDDWRRENVRTFIKELYDDIQKTRPDLRFGIGPAGVGGASASQYGLSAPAVQSTDWMYAKIYCDPLAWLNDGTVDFVSPQIYWGRTHSTAPFEPLCKWWSEIGDHFGRHMYVSLADYKVEAADFGSSASGVAKELSAQVDLTRKHTLNDAPGAIYYNTSFLHGSYLSISQYVGTNNYQLPSLIPTATWKTRVNYAAPTGATRNGTTLSWTATKGSGQAIIRYTVYAIPSSVSLDNALASDGDGISNEYLLGVTYSNSYTLTSAQASNHWYAVCVYDGLGYESAYATIGYSSEPSQATTLVSPADGATAQWEQTFSWTAVQDATYTLQIASDKNFNTLLYNQAGLTATSQKVALDEMSSHTTAYWRVVTRQSGKVATNSSVRSFKLPQVEAAAQPVPVSPADGAEIESTDIQFSWQCPNTANLDGFRLEVADAGGDFSKPVYTQEVAASTLKATVRTSKVGKGSFTWRVVAYGSRVKETASVARSFAVTKLDVGVYEPGYAVVTDGGSYANSADGMHIENLWIRSSKSDYDNMSFLSNGSFNRGMAATATHVYLSARSANSQTADIYLQEYSATTGEHIRDIQLSADGKVPYYPCNDVIKDTAGNILVSNLTLNNSSNPVVLFLVNLENGELTEVASLSGVSSGRIDHVSVYGDVTTGTFKVFAPVSNKSTLASWKVSNGNVGNVSTVSIRRNNFYPTASNFGVAPRSQAISESAVYIDGGSTAWTLYNSTGTIAGSFSVNTALAPTDHADNGGRVFNLGKNTLHVYSHSSSQTNSQFRVAVQRSTNNSNAFAGLESLWLIPQNGLGSVESTTCSAPVDAVEISPSVANVYIYSPGNGLAAYRITDTVTGAADIISSDDAADVAPVYYDLQGIRVTNPSHGIYIERRGAKVTKRYIP